MGRRHGAVCSSVPCEILLVSGSLRAASTSAAVLRTARAVAPPGVDAVIYDGLERLPHFNPDLDADPLPAEVAHLRAAIHDAAAIVFSTPEYAGALPGSFKNLLDWTIGDDQPGSIYTKPVGWLNASPPAARTTSCAPSSATRTPPSSGMPASTFPSAPR